MPPGDFVMFTNIGLTDADTGGQTSTVGEPSVANNGRQIFMTGNWYATRSLDGGATWSHVSPFNQLPPVDGGFCCDQTVLYEPSRDLLIWLLQYITSNNTNTLRIAFKQGASLGNDTWLWWDLKPGQVNSAWTGEWFDYNHASLSNNFLYVGSNLFRVSNDTWTRSVIFRLPLDDLASGQSLSYEFFQSASNFSLRCVQGATDVMHIVSHVSNTQLRVFSWPESSSSVASANVTVSFWTAGNYSAPGPDGRNWLNRGDPRITGAWLANGQIGIMWSANRLGTARPRPYVRVVRIDAGSKAVIDEPDIWNRDVAYAYPTACPNDRGHVGITLFTGGGTLHPSHVVGIWDDYSNGWQLRTTRAGSNGPVDGKWGDYLACRRHAPDGLTWVASGFTLQGGGSRNDIEPRLVHFGRERDRPAVERWANA